MAVESEKVGNDGGSLLESSFVSTLMSVMMIERLIEVCLFAVLTTSERGVGGVLVV